MVSETTKTLLEKSIYYDFEHEKDVFIKANQRTYKAYLVNKMEVEELEIDDEDVIYINIYSFKIEKYRNI